MIYVVGLLLIAMIGAALRDWKTGVVSAVILGFLADPLRKLLPAQPVWMVITSGLVFGAAVIAFLGKHGVRSVQRLPLWRSASQPLELFVLWIAFSSGLSLARYHNPVLAGIGLMSYFAPLPALVLAYHYGSDVRRLRTLLLLYLIIDGLMQLGVYLEFLGFEWPLLKQVGEGMVIYEPGVELTAHCGFFRAPELAAWHAGTAIALLIMLVNSRWIRLSYPLAGTLLLFFMGAGLLTGRRKFFAILFLFICIYFFLLNRTRHGTRNLISLAVLSAGIGIFVLFELVYPTTIASQFDPYLQRTGTVFSDAPERIRFLGFESIRWAVSATGFLGGGAGIASQGGQHFGRDNEVAGAGEGGLGKITVELGVPGLLLVGWIAVTVVRFLLRLLRKSAGQRPVYARMALGIFAILAANAPAFFVAAQVFGDLFVLLTLGLLFGFLLALSELAAADAALAAQQESRRTTPMRAFAPGASQPSTAR